MSSVGLISAVVVFVCCLAAGELSLASGAAEHVCSSGQAGACGNVLLQQATKNARMVTDLELDNVCDEESWPDKDHGLVCGECKVLVDHFDSEYHTCNGYCASMGRECVGAWEEENDNCNVLYDMTCDQTIASSDAICECGLQVQGPQPQPQPQPKSGGDSSAEGACYGDFAERAVDEGSGIGVPEIHAQSLSDCTGACDGNDQCKSFSYCPGWGKCWLKDRSFSGGEATAPVAACRTYYKKPCGDAPSPTSPPPTPALTPGARPTIKVVSYNLYWWNAYTQNNWKFDHIADNIKNTLQADSLGLQECDEPDVVRARTGYEPASPFQAAQGVSVKPGVFAVGRTGFRDIQATGKWGPRYVTWAELTHLASGRAFFHFNTHWCVHSGNGRTCNSGVRYQGARNMLDAIRQEAGTSPVVITGDFNANMNEQGPQHFLANGFALARTSWVDAIFYSVDHWHVVSDSVGDPAHSDHAPVIAELQMK